MKFVAGSVITSPLIVRAQPATAPVVGCLMNQSPGETEIFLPPFRQGLSETGYVEGQNLRIEYRWAAGQNDRLPELAADLINLPVAVIAAFPSASAALAAKKLTTNIPIVFEIGGDPVELGLVASLNKPGGNVTGATSAASPLVTKQLGLLGELVPNGPSRQELLRQVGVYSGRILRGAKPADLPVIQAARFELVINLKTAKTLGLEVPTSMQMLADEVIE